MRSGALYLAIAQPSFWKVSFWKVPVARAHRASRKSSAVQSHRGINLAGHSKLVLSFELAGHLAFGSKLPRDIEEQDCKDKNRSSRPRDTTRLHLILAPCQPRF